MLHAPSDSISRIALRNALCYPRKNAITLQRFIFNDEARSCPVALVGALFHASDGNEIISLPINDQRSRLLGPERIRRIAPSQTDVEELELYLYNLNVLYRVKRYTAPTPVTARVIIQVHVSTVDTLSRTI